VQYAFIAFPLKRFWFAPEGVVIVSASADFQIVPMIRLWPILLFLVRRHPGFPLSMFLLRGLLRSWRAFHPRDFALMGWFISRAAAGCLQADPLVDFV
jgi:hypothetical protein